ncbi:MAG: hypothetical protein IPO58_08525 [Betaproteobacteria bacterium]|nr:hypothetical protein [Betaproteobacteria bacterium]
MSSLECGLLPLSLEAAQFYQRVAYYDFAGISDDRAECALITPRWHAKAVHAQPRGPDHGPDHGKR